MDNNMKKIIISKAEEFRQIWGNYYYLNGWNEEFQDIQTKSIEDLIHVALIKAINTVKEETKEINQG